MQTVEPGLRILVTGAAGFIGRALCSLLDKKQMSFLPVLRRDDQSGRPHVVVEDIHGATDWTSILPGISVIVHLAARVHVLNDKSSDPLTEFRRVNVDGTLNLARQAAAKGVRRFIYLSSIKVNGEETHERPFGVQDVPAPTDAYGISKSEAEAGLQQIARETGMELVIIRPPLVYGKGAGGNFGRLLSLVKMGLPLPLAAVNNRRSLVYVENLCDFIRVCVCHPRAAGEVLLITDGEDVSTPALIRKMAECYGRTVLMVPVPLSALRCVGAMLGRSQEIARLTGNLQIDSAGTQDLLQWHPPFSLHQGLARSVT